jgi:hypothetical protein
MDSIERRIEKLEQAPGVWTLEDETRYIGLDDADDDQTMPHYAVNQRTGERRRLSAKEYAAMLRQESAAGHTRFKVTIGP